MMDWQQKRKLRTALQSRVLLAALVLTTLVLGNSVYERYTVEREMAARRAEVEAELQELAARRATLEERVDYLSHERGIEAEMRRQYDIAREGEQVVIILEDEVPPGQVAGTSTREVQERPWYQFW